MKNTGRTDLPRRRAIGGGIAAATAGAVILASALVPSMATAAPGDESSSSSRFLSGSLLLGGVSLDQVAELAGVSTTHDASATPPNTQTSSLDLTALNALNIGVPDGLSVPLGGFLQLGAVNQYSQSSTDGVSRAAVGAVSDAGIVDTTGTGDYPSNASLSLQGLLGSAVTGSVADLEVSLEAISAEVGIDAAGTVTRDYNVAGGDLTLTLPAVGALEDVLTESGGVISTVDDAVNELAGPDGLLAGVLAGLNAALAPLLGDDALDISITTDLNGAVNTILDTPLGDGVVDLNLRTGAVAVDLDALLADTTGHGLNDLDPGEEVLSTAVIQNLVTRVGNLLQTVPQFVEDTLTATLNAATLNIAVSVCVVGTGNPCTTAILDIGTGLNVSVPNQTLGNVIDGTATATVSLKVAGLPITLEVGTLLNALAAPIVDTLLGPEGVVSTVVPIVTNTVNTVVGELDPVVDLLNGVVSLRGNVQAEDAGVVSEEAFVLTLGDILGDGGVGTIVLARAEAGPNEAAAAEAAITADETVEAGTDLTVEGTGWPANTEVSVQLSAPDAGPNVGDEQTIETDDAGEFTLPYPVPASAEPAAGYLVSATDGENTATTSTEVTAAVVEATVDAAASVQAGSSLGVTGAGWPAETTVTLELTEPGDGPLVGTAVDVETNASGEFTEVYPVPADTEPGTGYVLTATAGEITATDTTEVTEGDPGDANTNASASASASADATANGDPAAQAAAEAAALADATSDASAAADVTADAAAEVAATADASSEASATAESDANASAAVAAQAAAQTDASSTANAEASSAANANSSSSSEAAATATSSADASSEASANANATASASASANADASTDAVAEAAAQASAYSDDDASASAAATAAANAAAESAATATSSTDATADATSAANAGAAIAAQAAALADASSNTAADASADSDASTSAAANASAAAIATASTDASSTAVADADATTETDATATATTSADATADADAEVNTNASASASASANADDDSNADAVAAAVAAALADATSTASAAADVTANAAAQAAATDDASSDASTTADSDANVAAAAAAQAAAQNDATSTSAAAADASASADPNAAASVASNASSSSTASATAAADVSADATAEASAEAAAAASADSAADSPSQIGIIIKVPVLERGGKQTAIGFGFEPGESVTGVMESDPIALGTQIADAQGTVVFTWAVPSDIDLGQHTVTLTGETSGSVAATFEVVVQGGLAATGGELPSPWIVLGALLLLFGLGTALIGRTRRVTVDAE